MKQLSLCLLAISYAHLANATPTKIFILIHGTWASDTDWHLPGGTFYDELEKSCSTCNGQLIPYNWSGRLNHASRLQAAKGLVKIIQSYPENAHIYLIGHSHGGNVAALTSQLLGQDIYNEHKITALYTLGTPIDLEHYFPNMDVIEHVYNFFSRGDYVQQVLGLYTREYPSHERIANLRIIINDKEPGHCKLYHPFIARWLPHIPHTLALKKMNGFQHFCCANQGAIDFYPNKAPAYSLEFRVRPLDLELEDSQILLSDQEYR